MLTFILVVVTMAKHPASRKYDLSSIRKILCGAAPLGREVSVELESLWPKGDVNVKVSNISICFLFFKQSIISILNALVSRLLPRLSRWQYSWLT